MASKYVNNATENLVAFSDPVTTDKLSDKARRDLSETTELKEECLQQLRALIKDHNVICFMTDDFLLRFLRSKKYQIQQSFEALQNYVHQRAALHNVFLKLQPEVMKTLLRQNILGILPYRDSEGRLIIFYRSGIWNTGTCSDEELLMSAFVLLNYVAEDPTSQISGIVVVLDSKSFPFAHIPFLMRRISLLRNFLFKSLPARYSRIHVVNDSSLIRYILQIIDVFLPQKIKTRILFHGKDREVLLQHISSAMLPTDFGGSYGSLTNDHLVGVMEDYLEKLKEEQHYFFEQNGTLL